MNKGLDLIKRQQPEIIDGFPTGNIFIGVTKEELTELEKKLKAFEIIKEKQIDVLYIAMFPNSLEKYNKHVSFVHDDEWCLTQEEYDLLKEVLL